MPDQYYRIQSSIVEQQTLFNNEFLNMLENSKNTVEIYKNFFGTKEKAVYCIMIKKRTKMIYNICKWCQKNKIYINIDDANSYNANYEVIIRFDMIKENNYVIEI